MTKKWGVDPNCNCLTCKQRYTLDDDRWYCSLYADTLTKCAKTKCTLTEDQMWDIVHSGTGCPDYGREEKETDNG